MDALVLGRRVGPFDARIAADVFAQYGAGAVATGIFDAQNEGRRALVPREWKQTARSAVHGEHDLVVHRPIVPGEALRIWVDGHGARPAGRNAAVTLRYVALDANDELVAEQWWTTIWIGTTCAPVGEAAPDHAFPEDARSRAVGEYAVEIDTDMARRYAEASGDWSDHHFELEAAKRSGFDRLFLQGLCTMALCGGAVTELVAGGDPNQLRRLAVRFAAPTFLGEQLHVRVYDAGEMGYAFEADCAGAAVITHGRAELRGPAGPPS